PLIPAVRNFTLNFTITNLQFTADLEMPNSKKFKSTEKVMQHYVSVAQRLAQGMGTVPLISLISCLCHDIFTNMSKKVRDDTGVDAICSYRGEPSDATFSRVTIYHELSNMTNGITQLGHYSLDSQSLYVNG
ncbi:MUC16 protein, partial [Turnix velox]|nr:MUC16 protein [Turnix velox]